MSGCKAIQAKFTEYLDGRLNGRDMYQIAGHLQFAAILGHAFAGKCCGRKLDNIEERIGLQMCIASFLAGGDSGDVDGGRDNRLGDVRFVVNNGGRHFAEAAVDLRDGQVGDAEVYVAVSLVGNPGGGLSHRQRSRKRQNA